MCELLFFSPIGPPKCPSGLSAEPDYHPPYAISVSWEPIASFLPNVPILYQIHVLSTMPGTGSEGTQIENVTTTSFNFTASLASVITPTKCAEFEFRVNAWNPAGWSTDCEEEHVTARLPTGKYRHTLYTCHGKKGKKMAVAGSNCWLLQVLAT